FYFFFSSRRRHTRWPRDWSSDVCSSDLWRGGDGSAHLSKILLPGDLAANPIAFLLTLLIGFGHRATNHCVRIALSVLVRARRERSEERRVGKEWRAR